MNPATVAQYDSDSLRKPESVQLEFCGRTGEYFQIWLVNLALSLASCGLYMPWARVRTRRYFLSQTRVKASGFDYQANPWAMFAGWLVIGVGLGLVSNSRELLAMGLASATKLLLKNLGRLSELADLVEPLVYLGVGIAFLLLQMLVLSWLVMQSLRYNASKTSYRNLRFGFGSSEARFRLWREMVFLLGLRFLVPLSLGVLQPYVGWRWRRFLIRHRRFGTTPFAFTATPADFLRLHGRALTLLLPAIAIAISAAISAALLIITIMGSGHLSVAPVSGEPQASTLAILILLALALTGLPLLLLWSCWLEARAANLTWRCTQLGDLRFACTWRARDLLGMRLLHGLVLVASLGLAWPWVRIRNTRYRLQRISLSPGLALDGFMAGEQERVSALAEGGFALDDAMAGLIDISL
jgi:uncharacterized membrane protein YjgN (DUF898 family)